MWLAGCPPAKNYLSGWRQCVHISWRERGGLRHTAMWWVVGILRRTCYLCLSGTIHAALCKYLYASGKSDHSDIFKWNLPDKHIGWCILKHINHLYWTKVYDTPGGNGFNKYTCVAFAIEHEVRQERTRNTSQTYFFWSTLYKCWLSPDRSWRRCSIYWFFMQVHHGNLTVYVCWSKSTPMLVLKIHLRWSQTPQNKKRAGA